MIRCKNRAVAPKNARRRQRPLPRPESGLPLFYQEMSVGVGAGEDAKAQDVGDDKRRFAGAVHTVVGELVGRKPLRVEGAKAGFIAKKRPAGHGHTAREQNFNWRIKPDDGDALCPQKFGRTRLSVSAPAEREYSRFAQFERSTECCAKLRGFEQAERSFTVALEEFRDAQTGSVFDAVIEVDKSPGKLAGELRAYSGFS